MVVETTPLTQLTDQQDVFCQAYIVNFNGTEAALEAKYSPKTAQVQASQLLAKPHIQARIRELVQEQTNRIEISADAVINELALIGFFNIKSIYDENGALLPISSWPESAGRAVAALEVHELFDDDGPDRRMIGYVKKIKLWDKNPALTNLAKRFKLISDKVTINNNTQNNLVVMQELAAKLGIAEAK